VGKDALAETDKITLETARFIKDDYLQQNSFTKYDKYCPFYKSVEMMRNIATFHRLATASVEKTAAGNAEGQRITYNVIKQRMGDVLYKLTSQKFEDPSDGEAVLRARFRAINDELQERFRALEEEFR
jgi:V-type H+-transporting ATPase subunit A